MKNIKEKLDKEIIELQLKILQIEKEELVHRFNSLKKMLKELEDVEKSPQLLQE
jgi:hypothetical protein